MIELKAIMFKSLYVWMFAYNCSHFSNFLACILLFLCWLFLLYIFSVLRCAPLRFFMRLDYLLKKTPYLGDE
jgi:hypothetical protein